MKATPRAVPAKGAQDETFVLLVLVQFRPLRGRCKGTQQPDEVAYIPKTPL